MIILAAWWYKPEYSITELNTNSAITTPCHEEVLAINSWTTQTPYTLKGYAYSGKFYSHINYLATHIDEYSRLVRSRSRLTHVVSYLYS